MLLSAGKLHAPLSDIRIIPVRQRHYIADKPGAAELKNVKGDISFDNVSFHYEENTETVLNHINLEVEAGSRIPERLSSI